jgi:hypothetical protein
MEVGMDWTQLLKAELRFPYEATAGLIKKVKDSELGWKPGTGENWLTLGQLLLHLTNSCGAGCRGFVTGEWMDDSVEPGKPGETPEGLTPAERFRSVRSVADALKKLEEDRRLALQMIDRAGEKDLGGKKVKAPWPGGPELLLGQYILMMIDHLKTHRSQLFYYLKLQGKQVNTHDLYGM